MIKRVCEVCKKEYIANETRLKFGRQTTCSRECSYKRRGRILGDYNKDKSPWNKERTLSKEHIEKLSISHISKGLGNKNGFKKEHIPWNKGIGNKTSEVKKIRTSKTYKEWRKSVFERDNYICQNCGQIGGRLNAHHIKPFSIFPKLRLEMENGKTLCEKCHKKTLTFGNRYKNIYKISTDSKWDLVSVINNI